jgi:dihydrodipicolinate reductase
MHVDYTKPHVVKVTMLLAMPKGACVSTSGLGRPLRRNRSAARANRVHATAAAANFSIIMTLMTLLALMAAKIRSRVEVIDCGRSPTRRRQSRELAEASG